MTKEYDLLVFIARMQPFHLGHKKVIDQALSKASNVLLLLGSAGKARTIRNPLTYEERKTLLEQVYSSDDSLIIRPLNDITYNDTAWTKQVQDTVKEVMLDVANPSSRHCQLSGTADIKVGLIGANKDNSSYYLKLFPQWESEGVEVFDGIHATGIREGILAGNFERYQLQDTLLPKAVCDFFYGTNGFIYTDEFMQLRQELRHITVYKNSWKSAPYPVKHVTVDAVVEQSGHILLVRRRSEPGRGLFALPGGHLDIDEKTIDGMIRELKEETKIKVPEAVLRGSVVNKELFDDPHRSTIGRVLTHAFHIKLSDGPLPKVKGSDDADKAVWIPLTDLKEHTMYDDHYAIIQYFTGVSQ